MADWHLAFFPQIFNGSINHHEAAFGSRPLAGKAFACFVSCSRCVSLSPP